jgi:FtsP/CotA-like multicopper oxidase with cupredoxin domain
MSSNDKPTDISRRSMLNYGFSISAASLVASAFGPTRAFAQVCGGGSIIEAFPVSPLILKPFLDPLPVPLPLAPSNPSTWSPAPNPVTGGLQDSDGGVHQVGYNDPLVAPQPAPLYYKIELKVAAHSFSSSPVLPINANGDVVTLSPTTFPVQQSSMDGSVAKLPDSTIYGFNGTFPGPMIYARYGQPAVVRFVNRLNENPLNLPRQNFGVEEFLTHLHNGHTAPESDGNPNYKPNAYRASGWVDNLYLNWPAGGDKREMQSFLWFHDHRMDHTGANVYKGMVGLYPIYDPQHDSGDETRGYRLPGVPNATTKRIDYDIPLAFYDCCLDDGVTPHQDFHNGCGETHPEWWGKTFFRHFPNHGFVGDLFTVNGKAFPVVRVKRRRYRLRFLDASIARIYDLKLMASRNGPVAARSTGRKGVKLQGQYQLPDGQQCMKMVQIASEGGLLPFPLLRNSIEIWPAKRREVIVDFSRFMDGRPTCATGREKVIYLVNTKQMTNGRKPNESTSKFDDKTGLPLPTPIPDPDFDPDFRVPVLKIIIEPGTVTDNSFDPIDYVKKDPVDGFCSLKINPTTKLPALAMRALPPVPMGFVGVPTFRAELQRSGKFGGEIQWLINGRPFEPREPLAFPLLNSTGLWTFKNGGGGWVHPLHLHMEEHRVISRNGVKTPSATDPAIYTRTYNGSANIDDIGREDVISLAGGEEVVIWRKFRTFRGPYVAHCHNLAHEDHAMMFGWNIV